MNSSIRTKLKTLGYASAISLTTCFGAKADSASDQAREVFDSLYGKRMKTVIASRGTEDDVELANDLLSAARMVDENELLTLLFDNAHKLASRSIGDYGVAIRSMRLKMNRIPATKMASLEKITSMLNRKLMKAPRDQQEAICTQYVEDLESLAQMKDAAGDHQGALRIYRRANAAAQKLDQTRRSEIRDQLTDLQNRMRKRLKLNGLIGKLKANPNDATAAHDLAMFYAVEMDDASKALLCARKTRDADFIARITLTGKNIAILTEQESLQMGDWYASVARKATNGSRVAMMQRAHQCYSIFLQHHPTEDLAHTKVRLTQRQLEALLKNLGSHTPSTPQLVKLQDVADIYADVKTVTVGNMALGRIQKISGKFRPIVIRRDAKGNAVALGYSEYGRGRILFAAHHDIFFIENLMPKHMEALGVQSGSTLWTNFFRPARSYTNIMGEYTDRVKVAKWNDNWTKAPIKRGDVIHLNYRRKMSDKEIAFLQEKVKDGVHLMVDMLGWVSVQYDRIPSSDLPKHAINRVVKPMGAQFLQRTFGWKMDESASIVNIDGEVVGKITRVRESDLQTVTGGTYLPPVSSFGSIRLFD